jgi:hypothetical protein
VTLDQDRSASLLVRVWLESGADGSGTDGFRARLTSVDTSPGAGGDEVTVGVASSPTEVLAVVETWLTTFLGPDTSPDPDPSSPDSDPS